MRWGRFAASTLAVAAVASASEACAMSAPASNEARCSVVGGEKLPPDSGGPEALCAAVRAALGNRAPSAHVTVEVRVLTPSTLATTLMVEGRVLPEQKFAVMDRNLNPRSIERFAQSVATKVAEAAAL